MSNVTRRKCPACPNVIWFHSQDWPDGIITCPACERRDYEWRWVDYTPTPPRSLPTVLERAGLRFNSPGFQ